jgi:acetoin utilization protein AcuB
MSLVVSFEGRLVPYSSFQSPHGLSVQKAQRTKKIVEELHQQLDPETGSGEAEKFGEKSPNQYVKIYQKSLESLDRQYYARDIMQTQVKSLKPTDTIQTALDILDEFNFRHLPVTDNGKLVGIVSDRLLLKSLSENASKSTSINQTMVTNVITSLAQTNIVDIARAMMSEKISCLLVIDNDLNLKGIMTTSDLLGVIIRKLPFYTRVL